MSTAPSSARFRVADMAGSLAGRAVGASGCPGRQGLGESRGMLAELGYGGGLPIARPQPRPEVIQAGYGAAVTANHRAVVCDLDAELVRIGAQEARGQQRLDERIVAPR